MKVIGLISGGKDSFFNMMHCVANGHSVVALANLHPAESLSDELDSYMYQTVGHGVIPMYARATGLPLYREVISGSNVQTALHYSAVSGDETEDLYRLLERVKKRHPEATGISVGAIASNYQRLRVENVASRLGMTVLAYLWERDQQTLLRDMVDAGVIAIIIKVACVGLNRRHLGMTLAEIQTHMLRLHDKYGVHPCGEGGEYETLVLDCPLFSSKLRIVGQEVIELESDTAHLRLEAECVEKESEPGVDWMKTLLQSADVEEAYNSLLQELPEVSTAAATDHSKTRLIRTATDTSQIHSSIQVDRFEILKGQQLTRIKVSIDADEVLHCTLILHSMNDFGTVNTEYAQLWNENKHPPTRICFSTPLPNDTRCLLFMFSRCSRESLKDATTIRADQRLWVQSRSYWAPSNIGPYSQAATSSLASTITSEDNGDEISHKKISFVSGQIGLIPNAMQLASSVKEELVWAMQSLSRILSTQSIAPAAGVIIIYYVNDEVLPLVISAIAWSKSQWESVAVGIQLLPGSELPRKANIELQFLTPVALESTLDASECLMIFSTTSTSDQMSILVSKVIVEGGHQLDGLGLHLTV